MNMTFTAIKSWKKSMMIMVLLQAALATGALSNTVMVTITSNITNGVICYNQSIELICHTNGVNVTTYKWTSTKFKQAEETASITVTATDEPVEYYCTVTDANGKNGYSSVSISSNASAPELYPVTFYSEITVFADSYVNLTVQVTSNLPLTSFFMWSRHNAELPKHSHVMNYSKDGNNFTSLIIGKASYFLDGGLYYMNTSNQCGPSSISVVIKILRTGGECYPSGHALPLLSGSNNQSTVEGEVITFSCTFKGNYKPLNYPVYYIVTLQNGTSITVNDHSNYPDYHVSAMKNCPFTNSSCCRFVTKLEIRAAISSNNAMITCNAMFVDSFIPTSSVSYLMVEQRPILTGGPADAVGVKNHESVHFQCRFNASLIPYLAICGWLKDGHNASNGVKSQSTEPGFENHLICDFIINSVSVTDEGKYSCYCYYNESFREHLHFGYIVSKSGEAALQLETTNDNSLSTEEIVGITVLCLLIIALGITTSFTVWCSVKYYRERQDGDNNHVSETGLDDESSSHDEDADTVCSGSAESQPEEPMESNQTDNDSVSTTNAEGAVNLPLQEENDYSANVTSLCHTSPVLEPGPGSVDKSIIKIIEEPKDHIIQFKNNKEVVRLTCAAESPEGYDLHYQWYCVDSDDIMISDKSYVDINLETPTRNTEKQYYCIVSIANELEYHMRTRNAVIKLEIIWFVEQPEMRTIVFTGNKLELSCRAEAAQGMKVEYFWFKCLKKDGFDETPTYHLGNRMIVPVCNDTVAGHYMCKVFAKKQEIKLDSANSIVARVKVVNSTNVYITKEPPSEVYKMFGEELILKCKASCKHHVVRYQWYNNTKPVAGAVHSTLAIASVSEENVGSYYCEVTSDYSATRAKSRITQVRMNYTGWSESLRSQVQARDKMALLIGNSSYARKSLKCSTNDVKAVTERLQQLNFKTISLVDLTLSQMTSAVDYFCSLLDKGMYAIFYYSGHGVEVNKTTYFVPVDADDKELNIVQYNNSDVIAYKLQQTLAKVIMVLDCCRDVPPEGLQIPPVQFNGNFSLGTICRIYACASSFQTVEMHNDENSFMTKALLQALDHPGKKSLCNDLYRHITEYYATHNVSALSGQSFIRPEIRNSLSVDISLDDPILPSSDSKPRDLLLATPKECYLSFSHPTMKRNHKSISLKFEPVYSSVIIVHVYCDAATQPILRDVKLSYNPGLSLTKLESKGIVSYEISNLLVLMDVYERGESYPKLQFTFQMAQDISVTDQIEYEIPSDLISLNFCA